MAKRDRAYAERGTVRGEHIISFSASTELRDALNAAADHEGRSRSVVIREAVEEYLYPVEYAQPE